MAEWTPEAIDRCQALWKLGVSASKIAKTLYQEGLFSGTRNAVIGKLHRTGQEARTVSQYDHKRKRGGWRQRPAPLRVVGVAVVKSPPREFAPSPIAPLPAADGAPIGLLALEAGMCRWPYRNAADTETVFCARPALGEGESYCARHAHVAHQPPPQRNRARSRLKMGL